MHCEEADCVASCMPCCPPPPARLHTAMNAGSFQRWADKAFATKRHAGRGGQAADALRFKLGNLI